MTEIEKSLHAEPGITFEEQVVDDLNTAILDYTQASAQANPELKREAVLRVRATLALIEHRKIKLGPFIVPKIDGLLQRKD
jgi:hypothetical protein